MEDTMFNKCLTFKPLLMLRHRAFYATTLIILCLAFLAPGCKKSQDEPTKGKEEKSTEKTVQDATKQESKKKVQLPTAVAGEEAILTLVTISQNAFGVELKNTVPVRLIQFTVNGIEEAQVRPTARTEGFLTKFIKENRKVTILSPSGNTIAPGSGFIVELGCDAATATLSEIKIAK